LIEPLAPVRLRAPSKMQAGTLLYRATRSRRSSEMENAEESRAQTMAVIFPERAAHATRERTREKRRTMRISRYVDFARGSPTKASRSLITQPAR